jgi:teichuronic acid biosynthesis glycosyltransferase TuaC
MTQLRLLTFSTLFPHAAKPNHGIFVENRLRHLVASGHVDATVLAPVPWFPSQSPRWGEWAKHAAAPKREVRNGLAVYHPRFPVIPKLGMTAGPWLLYRAMQGPIRRLLDAGEHFDAIDAHYVYPDGVAAAWLGRHFGLPVAVTARGTDVSLIPNYARPRRLIQGMIAEVGAMVAVSAALKQALVSLGAPDEKVTVLRNGIETDLFRPPQDRTALRARLGLHRPTLISVGALIDRKGHHRTIEAMRSLPAFELLIIGEGPERDRLSTMIRQNSLSDRVRLLGARPHRDLPDLYGAADISVLASSREGWANVLLESMACGTPVIASDIWGNPEVVRAPEAGLIYEPNTAQGIADAVNALVSALPPRAATRRYAEAFSWDATTAGQLTVFRRLVEAQTRRACRTAAAMNPANSG